MSTLSRRQLLKHAAVGSAGILAAPYFIPSGVLAADGTPGANDRIRIGAIGAGAARRCWSTSCPTGGRLWPCATATCRRPRSSRPERRPIGLSTRTIESILDRKDVDAVIVATAEFQRVLPCIRACQAGKDIYAEKPLTLYIKEGRPLVDAVRKYGRILQVGSQQRSMTMNRIACELVRNGGLGKVEEVRVMNYKPAIATSTRAYDEEPIPDGLDWDVWLSQAPQRPYNKTWMKWMDIRDFSGGELTNWGAHGVDQIQWALGTDGTGPVEMEPVESATHGEVELRYANGVPVRFILSKGPYAGAVFVCENGKIEINRNKFTSNPTDIAVELLKKVDAAEEEQKWSDKTARWQAKWHMENWIDCIRTRQKPAADVEIGHRSISVCHLVAITRSLKRRLQWDPVKELFVGDDEANGLLSRPRRKGYELPEQT